jgi:hypothetical protein
VVGREDKHLASQVVKSAARCLGRHWWLWLLVLLVGVVTNFGTAALRMPALVASPQAVDFGAYYAGAWAMRLGVSPFYWPGDFLASLAQEHGLTVVPTPPLSTPAYVWMSQVFTLFSFPVASWLWLLVGLLAVLASTRLLVCIAGLSGWRMTLLVLPFTVTFGPTFVNLTTGQNVPLVLLAALLAGRYLAGAGRRTSTVVLVWTIAVAAKIYPLLWAATLPFFRKWRLLASLVIVCAAVSVLVAWHYPVANRDYWSGYLVQRNLEVEQSVSPDDQSLQARIALIGTSNTIYFSGMQPGTKHEKVWHSPWALSAGAVKYASLAAALALLGLTVLVWARADLARHGEGLFYMVVTLGLLPIPHMERYNHLILLPAMAWLWGRGGAYRWFTVVAYSLAGLSRLNHLWAILLPWPFGPIATGGGAYAAVLLGGGIAYAVAARRRPLPPDAAPVALAG